MMGIDLDEFLPSQGPQNNSKFLYPSGGLPYLPGKAAGNLGVSNFWRDQVEKINVSTLLTKV